jgi:CheY-like chemotaxis protein
MSTKILNVDDHEVNRYLRTQVLQSAGYSIIEAATGAEALARYAADRPQMVLLDVNLPDMSGFEVCRLIKDMQDGMTTVVVHISATAIAIEQQTEGLEGGADGYLAEPVEPDFLVAQVRSLLRLQSAEERLRRSEERFRSVFAEAPIGMMVFGPDLRLQQVNATFCRLFGYGESDLIGMEVPRLVRPGQSKETAQYVICWRNRSLSE